MTASEVLADLTQAGGRLVVDGGRVRVVAPEGALTPELRGEITRHKAELTRLAASSRSHRWQAQPRQELDHLDAAGQELVIRHLAATGALLVLEAEDGTLYRCHEDGVELPLDIATLPRYEFPELDPNLARQPFTAKKPTQQTLTGRPSPSCDSLQP